MDMSELRLIEILKKRYKCDVEIHFLQTLDGEENPNWQEKEKTIFRNRMAKFLVSGKSILFPIYRTTDILVAIEVCNTDHLKPEEVIQIKDCVELVFNDMYDLKEKTNLARQRQSYLESKRFAPNVIPFKPKELH